MRQGILTIVWSVQSSARAQRLLPEAVTTKLLAVHTLLALAAQPNKDVTAVFLNGDLHISVCTKQPEGWVVAGQKQLACKRQSLYQAQAS